MQYVDFERKLETKFSKQRERHAVSPMLRPGLDREIRDIDEELQGDPEYGRLLKEYAMKTQRIG